MSTTFSYTDPTGNRAVANVQRREKILRHINEHHGSDVRGICRSLKLPQRVVIADLVHLVANRHVSLGVIANNDR